MAVLSIAISTSAPAQAASKQETAGADQQQQAGKAGVSVSFQSLLLLSLLAWCLLQLSDVSSMQLACLKPG
jgi:hypothetical protein